MATKPFTEEEVISPTETTRPLTEATDDDFKAAASTNEAEHALSFFKAIKLYPKAVAWSIYFSIGVIMLSFDPQLLGNLYATNAFQRDFGYEYQGSVSLSCYQASESSIARESLTKY